MEQLDLTQIRKSIDETDDRILELFKKRLELCDFVAKNKQKTGKNVRDEKRENEIIERLTKGLCEYDANAIRMLYSTVFEISRARQHAYLSEKDGNNTLFDIIKSAYTNTEKIKHASMIACQGVEGAYSQIACKTLFEDVPVMYFENFESVFKSVESGLCKYGVLPFENSIYGNVVEVYDLLAKKNVSVVRSVKLPIRHALLVKKGVSLCDVNEIYSHKQAIGQCSNFLAENKNIKVTICENTAVAARMVANSQRNDVAAIASPDCAKLYGLNILKKDLQNSGINFTMFYCISKEMEIYNGANKAAFMFNIPNRTGALFNVLARFAAFGVNLTKIESRPICGKDFEFMFYAEADIGALNEGIINLFSDLENSLDFFKFIGAYEEINVN